MMTLRLPRPAAIAAAIVLWATLAPSPAPAVPSSGGIAGRWLIDFDHDGSVQLTLKRRENGHGSWNSSDDYRRGDFQGLTVPAGGADVPARFTLSRDAGTLTFEGMLNDAGGSGHFTFAPNPEYLAALGKLGYPAPDEDDVFSLAVHDVSREFLRELESLGYAHVPLDDAVSMRIHGANPEFIRALQSLGYSHVSTDDLVSMRIHGATPDFVRQLKALGYEGVSADDGSCRPRAW